MSVTIYHNPRCSKSRQTLELLRDKNIDPSIVEYLKNPPNEGELQDIISMLGITARDLLRKKETEYKELGLDNPELSDADIIRAMITSPKLMERPIVVKNGNAAIGRPPEDVLKIL